MGNKTKQFVKIIGYILIPIFILISIFSALSLYYRSENQQVQEANNFFETDNFMYMYSASIINNFSINANSLLVKDEDGDSYYSSNRYGIYDDYQENVQIGNKKGRVNYLTTYEYKNFKYLIIDNKNSVAYTNVEHTMFTDSIEEIKERLAKNSIYWNYEKGNVNTSIEKLKLEEIRYKSIYKSIDDAKNFSVYTSLENDLTYYDQYRTNKTVFDMAQILYKPALYLLPLSIVAVLVLLIMNCFFIGLRNENGEVILNAFDKTPLLVALIILFILFMIGCGFLIALTSENLTLILSGIAIGAVIVYISFVFFLETIIKRIKSKTLFRNTITYRILRWIKSLITSMTRNANMTVKLILIFIAFGILNIIGFGLSINNEPIGFFILIAIWVYAFAKMHQWLVRYIEIKNAINEIYIGNTEVHLDEKRYKGSLNSMAIQVNDIAGGLSNAIQEKLKSERLKTELITNVSHDIKTPLTSIINYVDLLKKEKMPNEQAEEYLNILDNKSQRLKRLTEDLVEASKASSGNIKLNIEKLNVNELLKQVSGEFEDKFKSRNLEEVMSLPEKNVYINADSRYMYRILENMYSNISKYAMDNTRVYIDVIPNNNRITIQMKNISKEKLNISTEELMQRFVRGDSARNTEGSGLGLSIATSLTTLQGGTFNIYLDGDLYKVIIEFDMIN
ncbi:MAG: histidine kinase dimerization/phospho-acceptor domain-containing protein [Clostridia bacterium]|nr:histidine kinase dimerization/phospho-acceptor domain-containing protein [Clostridia bacterium]